jgi:hypothetical protein
MDFVPEPAPTELQALSEYVEREFRRLGGLLKAFETIDMNELNAEPERPRDGQVVWADGTNWNPGSGAGIYARISGSWTKL